MQAFSQNDPPPKIAEAFNQSHPILLGSTQASKQPKFFREGQIVGRVYLPSSSNNR
jgi:hypothetical protein